MASRANLRLLCIGASKQEVCAGIDSNRQYNGEEVLELINSIDNSIDTVSSDRGGWFSDMFRQNRVSDVQERNRKLEQEVNDLKTADVNNVVQQMLGEAQEEGEAQDEGEEEEEEEEEDEDEEEEE